MKLRKVKEKLNENNINEINALNVNWKEIDNALIKFPLTKPIPASVLKEYSYETWRIILGIQGVYQIPTIELIQFLDYLIKGKKAIEICCGHGTIANTLGIPATDKKLTEGTGNFAADLALKTTQTPFNKHPHNFPDYVEKLTAHEAVEKYRPQVVIGCWVTHKCKGKSLKYSGSAYGVEEEKILEKVETYVLTGNESNNIYKTKPINCKKHYTIEADWLYDRGSNRGNSQIKIWTNQEPDWDSFPENLDFEIIY